MGMKIIRRITIALFLFIQIPILFIILQQKILPAHGFQLSVNTTETSMNPTMKKDCLVIYDENYPFEDVQIGDIICFKERPSLHNFLQAKKKNLMSNKIKIVVAMYKHRS